MVKADSLAKQLLMSKYPEYNGLKLPVVAKEILAYWKEQGIFEASIESRKGKPSFTFFEGPPSANGLPGIHHVMARSIKDIFCRYKTQKGFQVLRKAGWDTHGLPVELSVEKELGITKEDIGKTISVKDYNKKCRENVMKYTDVWQDLTEKMGYWVNMDDPYITYDNKYIESVWHLLSKMYNKDMLYKGYTIQPFSPKAGTGLSTHELNQPGCYRDVKDTSCIAQFKITRDQDSEKLFEDVHGDLFFIAWTTTPWTLPSNCALAVGPKIEYVKVKTFNQYTFEPITVIMAKDRVNYYFPEAQADLALSDYEKGQKKIPFELGASFTGAELTGVHYEQLLPYVQPKEGDAFRVIPGDFVTTEDGTGIVHTASVFGADDFRVCQQNNVPSILVTDENGQEVPLVDRQGRFVKEVTDFAGEYVKEEYYEEGEKPEGYKNVDIKIAIKLKEENRAFKVEKYEHSYPHCWRTDKPVLYYPLDSWFVKTTAVKQRMMDLNKTINWKPEATGTGRFGNWLENLVDWNLSRSRYWGIPIPVWTSEDRSEQICVGSAEQLKEEIEKAVAAGVMKQNPLKDFVPGDFSKENYETFDFHRPFADEIVLVSDKGTPLYREADLIDVWFDSGSMPYAQWHYPFENKELFEQNFPADFIAEGVDQTRGWFFTLHAIAAVLFDSVAYKNVVSNGLVLDKEGNKMSKRLGNAVDPFTTLETYGADATRWYMITNAQPWDNLRFDLDGIAEVQRKFFGTLYNTYSFFSLYANIDGFSYQEDEIPLADRPEIDRWILSELYTLVKQVTESFDAYEPTKAGRAVQYFVDENLSNWYVRLCRRRFWKGDYEQDKIAAYQTLYTCLNTVAKLMAPIAPFYSDRLYLDLNKTSGKETFGSVHLADFPTYHAERTDKELEERMALAQTVTSAVLSIRKKERLKVRQPLQKIMIPVLNEKSKAQLEAVKDLILSEVNVKELEILTDSGILVKQIKPDFKVLGPRFGKSMKSVVGVIAQLGQEEIARMEQNGALNLMVEGQEVAISREEVEIHSKDIPGWLVTNLNNITVALDVTLTEELKEEGIARELVNRVQNIRKDKGLEVTDTIRLVVGKQKSLDKAIESNKNYICSETLARELELVEGQVAEGVTVAFEDVETTVAVFKLN